MLSSWYWPYRHTVASRGRNILTKNKIEVIAMKVCSVNINYSSLWKFLDTLWLIVVINYLVVNVLWVFQKIWQHQGNTNINYLSIVFFALKTKFATLIPVALALLMCSKGHHRAESSSSELQPTVNVQHVGKC